MNLYFCWRIWTWVTYENS